MILLLEVSFESSQVWHHNLDNLTENKYKKRNRNGFEIRHLVTGLK